MCGGVRKTGLPVVAECCRVECCHSWREGIDTVDDLGLRTEELYAGEHLNTIVARHCFKPSSGIFFKLKLNTRTCKLCSWIERGPSKNAMENVFRRMFQRCCH